MLAGLYMIRLCFLRLRQHGNLNVEVGHVINTQPRKARILSGGCNRAFRNDYRQRLVGRDAPDATSQAATLSEGYKRTSGRSEGASQRRNFRVAITRQSEKNCLPRDFQKRLFF